MQAGLLALLVVAGCEAKELVGRGASAPAAEAEEAAERAMSGKRDSAKMEAAPAKKQALSRDEAAAGAPAPTRAMAPPAPPSEESAPPEEAAPTRSWFPETFLFAPLVVTDAEGRAEVPVKVPDRLTSFRVLALAHSKAGAQAGAVTSLQATLPVYVDPIVPSVLASTDRPLVAVQVVNTTDEEVSRTLVVEAEGAVTGAATRSVRVRPNGTITELVPLVAARPGEARVVAKLGPSDAVARTIEVKPLGRPQVLERSGTLAAPRDVQVPLPQGVEPGSARIRLTVFPGALALLRSEMAAAPQRSTPADDAYLLLLAGRARTLAASLGADLDDEELRRIRLLATQRALRHTRSPAPDVAALFAEPALAHRGDPLLSRLGERLIGQVASAQRPDGTFFGGEGWPLSRVLTATASGVRAVKAGADGDDDERAEAAAQRATVRARLAFERYLSRVDDAYTAAAILTAGAVDGDAKKKLVALVRAACSKRSDGSMVMAPGGGAVRDDGSRPSEVEATALAVLALEDEAGAADLVRDLAAGVLAAYRPAYGFGDGHTNRVALLAVTRVFKDPLPTRISVRLSEGGRTLADGVLEGERLREASVLTAPLTGREGARFRVEADPAVPGLAFQLALTYTIPWPSKRPAGDLDLTVERKGAAVVGRPLTVTLQAVAPGGSALEVVHRLPAGVLPDVPSLERLVASGELTSFDTEDGAVTLRAPARRQGEAFVVSFGVTPTLAGELHAPPSMVRIGGTELFVPIPAWTVKGR